MQKRTWAAVAAVGIASAIAIPTIAFGNARRDVGTLSYLKSAQTPYVATLTGAAETPGPGDSDGAGAAAITFDFFDNAGTPSAEGCWDLSYSGLTGTPTAAHIHRGAAGIAGPVVWPDPGGFTGLGANSATGCAAIDPALATEITTTPSNFYVNVHTTDFSAGAIRGQLAAGPPPAGEIHMLPTPLRAYDSRLNNGAPINPGETRTISLTSGLDRNNQSFMALPPGATAALVTLTVAETGGNGGFLVIYNADVAQPATSNINWKAAGQDIAVNTQVFVNASGQVKVTDGVGGGPTQFIIDVVGYLF